MYLIDTNVISEKRRGDKANPNVQDFWARVSGDEDFLPAQVVGELRRGVENLKVRGDQAQAALLEGWLEIALNDYGERVLTFNVDCAHIWGRLMSSNNENVIDKQVAAIALLYDLTVVTRNTQHFLPTGVRVLDPFEEGDELSPGPEL